MRGIIVCSTLLFAACAEQSETIHIAVYPSLKSCMVKETPMKCEQLPTFLRETLRAPANREITVSYAGTESPPKDDTSLDQIANMLKASGYQNARAVRFEMK